jgi:hypothetical protein
MRKQNQRETCNKRIEKFEVILGYRLKKKRKATKFGSLEPSKQPSWES